MNIETAQLIRTALNHLEDPGSAAAWPALPALADLSATGHDLRIDLAASDLIGAPLVIATRQAGTDPLSPLTPRQRQVARAIALGQTNKQIARDLGISLSTTKDHVHAILTRLKLQRRGQIAALVLGPGS